jgi:hypothetical protein
MRRIAVDDEIYAELERHVKGFEEPNDVLRRLLLGPVASPCSGSSASRAPGALKQLIDEGTVETGDTLHHTQVRKKRSFAAEIDPDGWVTTTLGSYREPSPALGQLVGTSINGWHNWIHDKSGKSLGQLRDQL